MQCDKVSRIEYDFGKLSKKVDDFISMAACKMEVMHGEIYDLQEKIKELESTIDTLTSNLNIEVDEKEG